MHLLGFSSLLFIFVFFTFQDQGTAQSLVSLTCEDLRQSGNAILYAIWRIACSNTSPSPRLVWSSWGSCSVTCEDGIRVRTRSCSTGNDADCNFQNNFNQQYTPCNMGPCAGVRPAVTVPPMVTTPRNGQTDQICGMATNTRFRILGGRPAGGGQFPWMVLVYDRVRRSVCGGSIIDNNHILTAAHCVYRGIFFGSGAPQGDASNLRVFSGAALMPFRRNVRNIPGLQTRRVSMVKIHENYNPTYLNNDIAILTLEDPIQYDDYHVPICLPQQNSNPNSVMCLAMGWGLTSNVGGSASEDLLYTDVTITSADVCINTFGTEFFDRYTKICLKGTGSGTCRGDSGGPIVCPGGEGRYYVEGIVSGGARRRCGVAPSFDTKVSAFVTWIRTNTRT